MSGREGVNDHRATTTVARMWNAAGCAVGSCFRTEMSLGPSTEKPAEKGAPRRGVTFPSPCGPGPSRQGFVRPRTTARARHGIIVSSFAALVVACGGQEPPPKAAPSAAPPKDPPVLAQIASACARVSACTHAHDAPRFRDPSACVDWWLSGSPSDGGEGSETLRKCLVEATTCEKVSTCMHGGGDAKAAAFCAQRAGVVSGCDGDRLVVCGEDDAHESSVVDCAKLGATCREVKVAGGLVVRSCFSPQKCPAGAPAVRCDGSGAVLSCHDGGFERVACRPGTTCEERTDEEGAPTAACELPGRRRCDVRGTRHCEDDRLVECDRTGHSSRARVTDCVGNGLRCAGVGPRAGCYVPSNVECDKEFLPRCEGGSVVFCSAGRLSKVACSSIGLGPCDPAAKGPMAACSAPLASTPTAPAK
jgi:hypothetical protein